MPESHQVQLQAYAKLRWTESGANSSVLCEPNKQRRHSRAHLQMNPLEEKYSVASVQVGVLLSPLPCTADENHS